MTLTGIDDGQAIEKKAAQRAAPSPGRNVYLCIVMEVRD